MAHLQKKMSWLSLTMHVALPVLELKLWYSKGLGNVSAVQPLWKREQKWVKVSHRELLLNCQGCEWGKTKKRPPATFRLELRLSHWWGTSTQHSGMPCPLSSQGKSKRVFVGSSGARGVFCKGLADERGNHILMHAKIIIGGICATGKKLDFSSSLMRKLRSSVAKYLLGESRGSRGVYSLKEMGGLSYLNSVIICVRGMLRAICLQWLSSCCPYEAGNYHPNLHPVCGHGPILSPDDAHTVLSFRESQSIILFFFFSTISLLQRPHISLCAYMRIASQSCSLQLSYLAFPVDWKSDSNLKKK